MRDFHVESPRVVEDHQVSPIVAAVDVADRIVGKMIDPLPRDRGPEQAPASDSSSSLEGVPVAAVALAMIVGDHEIVCVTPYSPVGPPSVETLGNRPNARERQIQRAMVAAIAELVHQRSFAYLFGGSVPIPVERKG